MEFNEQDFVTAVALIDGTIEVVSDHLFSAEEIGSELVDGGTISMLDNNVDENSHILTLPVSFHEIEVGNAAFDTTTAEIFEFDPSELTIQEATSNNDDEQATNVVIEEPITTTTTFEIIQEVPTEPIDEQLIQPVASVSKVEKTKETTTYNCDQCDAEFLREVTLKYHKMVHVDECYYACEFCSETKILWSRYYLHQCTNTSSKCLKCPHCNAELTSKKQLQIHDDLHSLQKRFSSKKMQKYFERKLARVEDKNFDWSAKPFVCGVCGKPFNKLYEVEYHEKLHNGERQSPHICEKCGLVYVNKQDLNKHLGKGCLNVFARPTR